MRKTFLSCSRLEDSVDFPLENLPYGVFSRISENPSVQTVGVRIGDFVLDLVSLVSLDPSWIRGPLVGAQEAAEMFQCGSLNAFMSKGRPVWQEIRDALIEALADDGTWSRLRVDEVARSQTCIPADLVIMHLPAEIGDYTDFYSSKEHATNLGTMFRGPENALMPNWVHLPVAYHGRASSIIPSGLSIRRPRGQIKSDQESQPAYSATRLLDFELEMAFFIGPGNKLGNSIDIHHARDHVFGMVLMNDWSARDIQKWEYVPLGPFLGKNFATSISPWVITLEALEPFRVPAPIQSPDVLPYLQDSNLQGGRTTFDINLTVSLRTDKMNTAVVLCRSNFRHLYWTMEQQLAHHTSSGCNARPGDLLASGTISGNEPSSFGSMIELSWRGTKPVILPNGEERKFLMDGDEVIMHGFCISQDGSRRIGFGSCVAKVLPALESS